jgi:hypothetical protein
MKVGDKVVWTPKFLASMACGPTDPMWFQKGVVTSVSVQFPSTIQVQWDDEEPRLVNVNNIAKPLTAEATDVPVWYSEWIRGRKIS